MLRRFVKYYFILGLFSLLISNLCVSKVMAQDAPAYDESVPKPTISEIRYCDHERNVLDFWQPKSNEPTPLVFVIHGGGWISGSKERVQRFVDVQKLLNAGISVVAINYRLIHKKQALNDIPPVKAPMHDAARALQFVRRKSSEWNIDKQKIGAAGGSAGACTALWLAFHDDLLNEESDDSVEWESTRLFCAGLIGAQTSLDPNQMKLWIPKITYGAHAFGIAGFDNFLASRDSILPWIKEYSPYEHVSADDPPIFIQYGREPGTEEIEGHFTHSASFGIELKKHCLSKGVICNIKYNGTPDIKYESPTDYLIATLLVN